MGQIAINCFVNFKYINFLVRQMGVNPNKKIVN